MVTSVLCVVGPSAGIALGPRRVLGVDRAGLRGLPIGTGSAQPQGETGESPCTDYQSHPEQTLERMADQPARMYLLGLLDHLGDLCYQLRQAGQENKAAHHDERRVEQSVGIKSGGTAIRKIATREPGNERRPPTR